MNILHLSAVKIWGGGENHIVNLCKELKFLAPEVNNYIFCKKNSQFHRLLKCEEINVISAPLVFKLDPRYGIALSKSCKEHKIDLIHIHDSTALALAVMTDQFHNLPPFILSKKTSFPIRQRRRTIFKYNYPKIKKILCVSEATRQISMKSIASHDRLQVIYHGTRDGEEAHRAPFSIRKRFNIPEDGKLIGNIGNHIEAKDLETFIRTAHYLVHQQHQKDLFFVQIGKFSSITKKLKDLVHSYELENFFFFTDYLPKASTFIPQFEVLMVTSKNEGIPQVIYESFKHMVPVISTNVGGISEIIEHRVNGLLCEAGNPIGLSENLMFLIANPHLIPNFAKISREKLVAHFTWEIMAQKTLEEYQKAIQWEITPRS